jgi:GT2 family glycosyltransferase
MSVTAAVIHSAETMNTKAQPNRTRGVLLLGMHRSGTSAMTRALGAMGLWVGSGEELLPAHASDNPEGYWERSDVHDAHVQYLSAKGHDWDRLAGFSASTIADAEGAVLARQLKAIIAGLDDHAPWLVKDPRLSVLLPFWQQLAPSHASIVAVRHPLEIAGSLRNSPRGVYATPFLLLLWQKYMARMLADLAGREAIFVSYGELTASPAGQLQRLGRLLVQQGVVLSDPDGSAAAGLLDRRLRRNRIDDDDAVLSPAQQALYDWLVDAAASEGAVRVPVQSWEEPDDALAEFEASADFFLTHGRNVAAADVVERLTRIETQNHALLEQAAAHQDLLQHQLAHARGQLEQAQVQLAHATIELGTLQREHGHAQSELTSLRSELARVREEFAATTVHVGNIEAMLRDIRGSLTWRLGAPIRWLGRLASPRLRPGHESALHRLYYRMPGLSPRRKRALIAWLHDHAPWLTRNTLSYQLHQAARQMASPDGARRWLAPLGEAERASRLAQLSRRPRISVIMPVHNTDPVWLQAAIASVQAQSYPDWELCIADDASTREDTRSALDAIDDPRIRQVRLEDNVGIALASNEALALATGEYVALLDHDDELTPDALLEAVTAIDAHGADYVYSDEDKIDFEGRHCDPHFKADYSPDYLLSINYLCHLSVMRRDLLERIGGFRAGFDGAQDYDLFLRYLEHAEKIVHIPRVLYHWRMHEGSTAAASAAKPRSWEAGRSAIREALARRGIQGDVELGPYPNTYCVRRRITAQPLVSVIIPFRDKPELLEACVTSVLERGGYGNIEIVAIDNGSREPATHRLLESLAQRDARIRVLRHDVPFNYSAINNWAAAQSRGEVLLFLNNDIEAISDGWLSAMLEHAVRDDVGVVGGLLLYPDDTVQHAGVIVGLGGVAGHAHLHEHVERPGYFSRIHLIQDMSAVTFACAMTRRAVFEQLGGLNETDLTIAFNDVDYCLRAREAGLRVIYTPCARLYHFESKSRGYEDTPEKQARFAREIAYMQRRHTRVLAEGDPFYNPNFALDRPSFVMRGG